jgi:DNA-binding NarL/FixJ family response regulator
MRVVIAEDMVLLRAGLAQLLTVAGIEVIGEAGTRHRCCPWFRPIDLMSP